METNKLTKEEKDLLIKDLSARLPYGVMIQHPELFYPSRIVIEKLVSIDGEHINDDGIDIEYIKPYLRSMEDMTEEEREILASIIEDVEKSDDKIEVLERLYFTIKEMLKSK